VLATIAANHAAPSGRMEQKGVKSLNNRPVIPTSE